MPGPFGFRSDFNPFPRRPQVESIRVLEEFDAVLVDKASLLVKAVIIAGDKTHEGQLVEAVTLPWFEIIELLNRDPAVAYQIEARKWEELSLEPNSVITDPSASTDPGGTGVPHPERSAPH
jgi:hypothetical protein